MPSVGIIAEFNPLHSGHEYLIKQAKKHGTVVCVLSGNFVQRGDLAIAEKRIRAEAALKCSADVVLELPVLWSMSTAQNFALGSVSILKNAGCDSLIFGSECGDTAKLCETAKVLQSDFFNQRLADHLKKGITFAAARQAAAVDCGADGEILSGANNNLAIEYIIACEKIGFKPQLLTVKRLGADHDSDDVDEFVSASLLRQKLILNDRNFCARFIPERVLPLFSEKNISDISRIEGAIISVLRTKSAEDLKILPDLSEGVENKLFSAIRVATNLEELYNTVKVKRYTLARIRRLVLSAFVGADNSYFMKPVPYIRVLGFSKDGEQFLKENLNRCAVPVITRCSQFDALPYSIKKIFETECRATDLYALSLANPLGCGLEYTSKIIKTE